MSEGIETPSGSLHAVVRWWRQRKAARLVERIVDLKAQERVWAEVFKTSQTVSAFYIEQYALLRGKIAVSETRLRCLSPSNQPSSHAAGITSG